MSDIINNNKAQNEWKVQITISSRDSTKIHTMHTTSDNIEIMTGYEINEIIEELFESLLKRYQKELQEKMRGSEFIYDSIDLLHYEIPKISLNRGGSYIDSPEWQKTKKATINPVKKKGDIYFQCAVTVALNYENIKHNAEKITKIKPFIDQYDWKEFLSYKNDSKKIEKKQQANCFYCIICSA